jgi:hypothetical protein
VHVVGEDNPGIDVKGRFARVVSTAMRNDSISATSRLDRRSCRFAVKKVEAPSVRWRRSLGIGFAMGRGWVCDGGRARDRSVRVGPVG